MWDKLYSMQVWNIFCSSVIVYLSTIIFTKKLNYNYIIKSKRHHPNSLLNNSNQPQALWCLACARHWPELLTCINSDPHCCAARGTYCFTHVETGTEKLSDLSKATQLPSGKARLGIQIVLLTTCLLFSSTFSADGWKVLFSIMLT